MLSRIEMKGLRAAGHWLGGAFVWLLYQARPCRQQLDAVDFHTNMADNEGAVAHTDRELLRMARAKFGFVPLARQALRGILDTNKKHVVTNPYRDSIATV